MSLVFSILWITIIIVLEQNVSQNLAYIWRFNMSWTICEIFYYFGFSFSDLNHGVLLYILLGSKENEGISLNIFFFLFLWLILGHSPSASINFDSKGVDFLFFLPLGVECAMADMEAFLTEMGKDLLIQEVLEIKYLLKDTSSGNSFNCPYWKQFFLQSL